MNAPSSTVTRFVTRAAIGGAIGLVLGGGVALIEYASREVTPAPSPQSGPPPNVQYLIRTDVSRALITGELLRLYLTQGDGHAAAALLDSEPSLVRFYAIKQAVERGPARKTPQVSPDTFLGKPHDSTQEIDPSWVQKVIPLIEKVTDPVGRSLLQYECAMKLPQGDAAEKIKLLAMAVKESKDASVGPMSQLPDTPIDRIQSSTREPDFRLPSLKALGYGVVVAVIGGISSPVLSATGKVLGRSVAGAIRLAALEQALNDGKTNPAGQSTPPPPGKA